MQKLRTKLLHSVELAIIHLFATFWYETFISQMYFCSLRKLARNFLSARPTPTKLAHDIELKIELAFSKQS